MHPKCYPGVIVTQTCCTCSTLSDKYIFYMVVWPAGKPKSTPKHANNDFRETFQIAWEGLTEVYQWIDLTFQHFDIWYFTTYRFRIYCCNTCQWALPPHLKNVSPSHDLGVLPMWISDWMIRTLWISMTTHQPRTIWCMRKTTRWGGGTRPRLIYPHDSQSSLHPPHGTARIIVTVGDMTSP